MKALVYENAHSLADFSIHLANVEDPAPRDQDVLVEVRAIGVNPGEMAMRSMKSAEPGGRVLLGLEFAGVVVGKGSAVTNFKVGDRVFGTGDMTRDGAWAERLAIDHRIIAHLPDSISFTDAASVAVGAVTAWEAVFRDQDALSAGVNRVLVLGGAGAIGSLATQLLKARTNAFVISTGSRTESKDWCKQMGADLVLDHSADIAGQLKESGTSHVDAVLSTAKTADNIAWIADILRPYGHLSVVDVKGPVNIIPLVMKSVTLHTQMMFSRIIHDSEPERQGKILATVAELVVEGRIKPIATNLLEGLTAETMRKAHELVETGRTIGKVVIAL